MASDDYVLAVDLGGSLTKIGYADADGRVHTPARVRTELSDRSDTLVRWLAGQLTDHVRSREARCRGYGVVVPGIIDTSAGRVVAAPNVGWYDVPLRDRLAELTGLPGVVAHDVRSAGLAEWRLGAGQGVDNLLFLPLGTGIAGAMVVDGRQLDADGFAGEIGHIQVAAAAELPCACGQVGCLETVASAAGVARSYQRLTAPATGPVPVATAAQQADLVPPGGSVVGGSVVGGSPAGGSVIGGSPALPGEARRVAELARAGDPAAEAAFALAAEALVEGLLLYLTLLGPELVVIGGGLVGAADLFLPQVVRGIGARVAFQRMPRIVPALLGADAGVIGAGLVGWDHVRGGGLDDSSGRGLHD